jgi:hypothetical protein
LRNIAVKAYDGESDEENATGEKHEMTVEAPQETAYAAPQPAPALQRLEKLVGTWNIKGRTLDSKEENISGQTTFEWLPGGFFLQQRFRMNFRGLDIQSLELIAYDPSTEAFASYVYSNLWGQPVPYKWDLRDDVLRIAVEGAKFEGRFSKDGKSFSGGWRPDPGKEGPGNVAYDVSGTRAK